MNMARRIGAARRALPSGPGRSKKRATLGRNKTVRLSVTRYRKLLEDLHDLAIVAERRDDESVPLVELKRRLKADGVL